MSYDPDAAPYADLAAEVAERVGAFEMPSLDADDWTSIILSFARMTASEDVASAKIME